MHETNFPHVGFVGLGLMGVPMVQRLLAGGVNVSVFNRTAEKAAPLLECGADCAHSLADVAKTCSVIMLCVTDTDAVSEVIDGLSPHLTSSHTIIDFSSIDPKRTIEMANALAEQVGAQWIDAPVSGGVAGAQSGQLVVMAGGNEARIDAMRPLLDLMSQRVTRMGDVGAGQTTKIANQMLVSCNVMVMAEVIALAKQAGVDVTLLPKALQGGFADSLPLQITGQRMAEQDFQGETWHVKTLLKDLNLAQSLKTSVDGNAPMSELALALMQEHAQQGFADRDPCTLVQRYLAAHDHKGQIHED